jgi:hypothetical protein
MWKIEQIDTQALSYMHINIYRTCFKSGTVRGRKKRRKK